MRNDLKFVLGVVLCIIGVLIIISTFFYLRYIPGGFIALALGLLMISESRKSR